MCWHELLFYSIGSQCILLFLSLVNFFIISCLFSFWCVHYFTVNTCSQPKLGFCPMVKSKVVSYISCIYICHGFYVHFWGISWFGASVFLQKFDVWFIFGLLVYWWICSILYPNTYAFIMDDLHLRSVSSCAWYSDLIIFWISDLDAYLGHQFWIPI